MNDQLQQYWKTIVDTMMDGLVVVDTEGTIVSVNRAMEQIAGYEREELIGQSCAILDCDVCFDYAPEGRRKRCDLFRLGEVTRRRCQIRKKDGRSFYVLKNAVVLRDGRGHVIGGVETLTDLTDLVAKERKIAELKQALATDEGFHGIIGRSNAMQKVYELVANAAESDAPIIIYGESGTGKELIADAIHELGGRKRRPFIKVSCAALNESLLESELFGHVKGAFTGADRDRQGRFEAAHKGDIFLDEIGDIPLSAQVKLLRVLQEKEVERVGDHRPIPIDVRVIAATHRDLGRMMEEGAFREDLFYRLNVIPIHLPPLRERREDIPLLVNHFIKRMRLRTENPIEGVAESTLEAMMNYSWPGNIRELINVLEYSFVICPGGKIHPSHLPSHLSGGGSAKGGRGRTGRRTREKSELIEALKRTGGRKGEAARILGISRVTLWKRLKQHGIEFAPRLKGRH